MVIGRVRQVIVLCSVNTTKYYLGRLVTGHYEGVRSIEVVLVFKTGSTVVLQFLNWLGKSLQTGWPPKIYHIISGAFSMKIRGFSGELSMGFRGFSGVLRLKNRDFQGHISKLGDI